MCSVLRRPVCNGSVCCGTSSRLITLWPSSVTVGFRANSPNGAYDALPLKSCRNSGGTRRAPVMRSPFNWRQVNVPENSLNKEELLMTTTAKIYDLAVEDIEYLRHGDTPLLARLFKPRGQGPFPLLIELHGGAWNLGDRLQDTDLNQTLAQSGIVVAALDFRMPPLASYPASLGAIHYAIRWFKTQATKWNS